MKVSIKSDTDRLPEEVDFMYVVDNRGIYSPLETSEWDMARIVSDGAGNVYLVVARAQGSVFPDTFEPICETIWRVRKFIQVDEILTVEFKA